MNQSLIKLEDVNLFYDKGEPSELQALKNVNLEINEGDYAAFFGPSGCGKSTLLYLISGFEKFQEGYGAINGKSLKDMTSLDLAEMRQNQLGFIFQSFNLIPTLNVLENVMLPMLFVGTDPSKRETKALNLLKRFGIDNLAERMPGKLSGGQQQRVDIARSLANDPPLVLADEPIGNLDSKNANAVLDLLKELHDKDGRTVIMVTHEAWSLRDAEKIFYMKDGAILNMEEKKAEKSKSTGISNEAIARLHPELDKDQVLVKSVVSTILRGYPPEETKRFEFFLLHLIQGKIELDEFQNLLDMPFKKGGVGLWKQTAKKISIKLGGILNEWRRVDELLKKLEKDPETSLKSDVIEIRNTLLEKNYNGSSLTNEQIRRLDEVINNRLRNIINPLHFRKVLKMPTIEGGVGLFRTTAEKMAQEMEIIVSKEFVI